VIPGDPISPVGATLGKRRQAWCFYEINHVKKQAPSKSLLNFLVKKEAPSKSLSKFPRQARGVLGTTFGLLWSPFLPQMIVYDRKIRAKIKKIKINHVFARKIQAERHIYDPAHARF